MSLFLSTVTRAYLPLYNLDLQADTGHRVVTKGVGFAEGNPWLYCARAERFG